jgi:hypothetical protein
VELEVTLFDCSQVSLSSIKDDVGDSQNTTNYLFATADVQDGNNYMFRPFLLAVIKLNFPSFKSIIIVIIIIIIIIVIIINCSWVVTRWQWLFYT